MASQKKRHHEVVDLTGDDDTPIPAPKIPRSAEPFSSSGLAQSSQGISSQSVPTPFSSSAFSSHTPNQPVSSQQTGLSQEDGDLENFTQADDGPPLQHYGDIDTKIVGVRFYNGLVSRGEVVVLRRDPANQ